MTTNPVPWFRPYVRALERERRSLHRRLTLVSLVMFVSGLACGMVLAITWLPAFIVP